MSMEICASTLRQINHNRVYVRNSFRQRLEATMQDYFRNMGPEQLQLKKGDENKWLNRVIRELCPPLVCGDKNWRPT